jgi:membrane glycosyltransferase
MNEKNIPQKSRTRLNRIKIVSRIFRTLIGIGAVMMLLISLWALMDSVLVLLGAKIVPGQSMTVTLNLSPNQSLILPYDVSLPVLILGAVHFCFVGVGFLVLNRLFKLY